MFLNLIFFAVFLLLGFVVFTNGLVQNNPNGLVPKYIDSTGGNPLGVFLTVYSGSFGILSLILGGVTIIAGSFIFPNPYLIFGGIFALGLPLIKSIGSDILSPISTFVDPLVLGAIVTVLTIGGVVAWLSWYHQTPNP